ncbi:DUF5412 family protein [Paramaledivibacter caminithermalis]|uniref:DUF5412 domain-containing protein n=1 Tax=Paramaledivibacter caminithermalis (strain DSM 15212 / CIP 107654 / DViRD3) TaxID=1121301 RepID=A0A1M6TYF1_PARC5|nr:DUF5412 family protein [Paramaledivibacter caminithermalis]SHK61913.1 hypothetical protein SAMN02745912_03828 [Paramaledivibacter caminithermalis DSM 15212]
MSLRLLKIVKKFVGLLAIILLIIVLFYYFTFYDMSLLPKGKLINEVYSPNREYIAKLYIVETAELCLKVDIVNTKTYKTKTIYWSWDEGDNCRIEWLDNEYILINGRKMNINTDTYNRRVDSDDKYK